MKNFNDLKDIWSAGNRDTKDIISTRQLQKRSQITIMKKQLETSTAMTGLFILFILWFTFLRNGTLKYEQSYVSLLLIAACSLLLILLNLKSLVSLNKLNETEPPREYLKRWVVFYKHRMLFYKYYSTLLFGAFCVSFAIYLPEILGRYPSIEYKVGFIIMLIILLISSIIFSKKLAKQEKLKLKMLNNRIDNLYREQ